MFCSISEPDTTFSNVFLVFSFLVRLEVLKNVEFCSVWRLFRRVSSFARFASMSLKHWFYSVLVNTYFFVNFLAGPKLPISCQTLRFSIVFEHFSFRFSRFVFLDFSKTS